MKRILIIALLIVLTASFASCAGTATAAVPSATTTAQETPAQTQEASAAPAAQKQKGETISTEDFDENGGADAYANAGDNAASRYYVNPDFFRMKSDDSLTLIEGFQTMQQTTEWSCGNATALMVLHHFKKADETEYSLAKKMGSHTDQGVEGAQPGSANNAGEYGTNVEQLYRYFEGREDFQIVESSFQPEYDAAALTDETDGAANAGNLPPTFTSASLYASENSDDTESWVEDAKDSYFVQWLTAHLRAGRPVMVEWGDWDGHWQAIIGYDSNGTPGIGDDILIFADPYDTSDHWQDGYYYYPLERWFYMWQDRGVAPKPLQLQPYLVVDLKS